MNIYSWFLEGAQYTLPDGMTMRAERADKLLHIYEADSS